MKVKFIGLICMISLMLVLSGTTKAVELREGPFLWKAFNWEVSASYVIKEGVNPAKRLFFRDETTSYLTQERGLLVYDAANPEHGLFSNLTIIKDSSLKDGEDAWGEFDIGPILWEWEYIDSVYIRGV